MLLHALRKLLSHRDLTRLDDARRLRLEALEERWCPATLTVDADGRGKPNTFATIQAAIDAADANDTIKVQKGTYVEALTVNKTGLKLKAEGDKVVLRSPADVTPSSLAPIGAALIEIVSRDVSVEGFRLDGSTNTDGELYAGIRVLNGGSATIEKNTITGLETANNAAFGNAIQIGTSTVDGRVGQGTATVSNNVITDYFGAGVLVTGPTSSAVIKDNTITGRGPANTNAFFANPVAQYGVQISRGASGRVEGNTVTNNDVDGAVPGGSNPSPASAGIYVFAVDGSDNVLVRHNKISGNDDGILVQDGAGVSRGDGDGDADDGSLVIADNDVDGSKGGSHKGHGNNGYGGIVIQTSSGVLVTHNEVHDNLTLNGIALDRSIGVLVVDNHVHDNANADGIYVFQGGGHVIVSNEVSRNGFNGILLQETKLDVVSDNEAEKNGMAGLHLLDCVLNILSGNESENNVGDGVWLENSDRNLLKHNEAEGNGGAGFRLSDSNCNVLFGCEAEHNHGTGFRLERTQSTLLANCKSEGNGGPALTQVGTTGTVVVGGNLPGRTAFVCPTAFDW